MIQFVKILREKLRQIQSSDAKPKNKEIRGSKLKSRIPIGNKCITPFNSIPQLLLIHNESKLLITKELNVSESQKGLKSELRDLFPKNDWLSDQVLRNLIALLSAALVFWIVQIGLIYLSMQFKFGYKFPEFVDVYAVFLAGLAAGTAGTIVSRNKSYLVLAGTLLLVSLPVTLILMLIPDGRPESVTHFVLICAVGAYACVRGFQHEWWAV